MFFGWFSKVTIRIIEHIKKNIKMVASDNIHIEKENKGWSQLITQLMTTANVSIAILLLNQTLSLRRESGYDQDGAHAGLLRG